MPNDREMKLAEKVLNYWYMIEFLGQDNYPDMWDIRNKVNHLKKRRGDDIQRKSVWNYFELKENDEIEKRLLDEAKACEMGTWGNLTIYIGKVSRESCIEYIAKAFRSNLDDIPEKTDDYIALASLQLSPEGRYIDNSLSLSTIVWVLNKIKAAKNKASNIIDKKEYLLAVEKLEKKLLKNNKSQDEGTQSKDSSGTPTFAADAVTADSLKTLYLEIVNTFIKNNIQLEQDERKSLKEVYGITFQLFKDEITRVNEEDDENYFGLNRGFFLDDLEFVLEKVRNGKSNQSGFIEKDVIKYINALHDSNADTGLKSTKRIDLIDPEDLKDGTYKEDIKDILHEILNVKNAPIGKWPSKFMPAFMQQVAINLSIGKGSSKLYKLNGRIFSVNGPPGTGKTTLLKEIVVNNIVERAILLANYDDPDKEAFNRHKFLHGKTARNSYSKYVPYWYTLKDDRINDYSVFVASCNNAAVENITKELPVGQKIFEDMQPSEDDPKELKTLLCEVKNLFDVEQSKCEEIYSSYNSETNKYDNKECMKDIYFTKYARGLLNDDTVWGLIAAPLGKKSNLRTFYNRVLNPLQWDFYTNNRVIEGRVEKFKAAKTDFLQQLDIVLKLQKKLSGYCDLIKRKSTEEKDLNKTIANNTKKMDGLRTVIGDLSEQAAELQKDLPGEEDDLEKAQSDAKKVKEELDIVSIEYEKKGAFIKGLLDKAEKAKKSAGFFTRVFNNAKYVAAINLASKHKGDANIAEAQLAAMQKEREDLQSRYDKASKIEDKALRKMKGTKRKINSIHTKIKKDEKTVDELKKEIQKKEQKHKATCDEYKKSVAMFTQKESVDSGIIIDDQFIENLFSDDVDISTKAQISNPWFTHRYNREREKLFVYAMKLNKEFVLSSKSCRDNLKTLGHYWGHLPNDENERMVFHPEDKEAFVGALYQTLFLLVPVISSTFASVGRLFKDIKHSGAIGTLVVDEAGQAQPQMAIGALYRSRRAVIVGDPKQVEPVVKDDIRLLKETFEDKDLAPYKSKMLSVQNFADKLNNFGTYLIDRNGNQEWVGSPLLIHRRCISPMFEISNIISYNNIMKQQTSDPKEQEQRLFIYDKSQWIDVKGVERGNKNHFVEAQGEKAYEMLEIAFSKSDYPNLYIISPFTSVVSGLRTYIKRYCRRNSTTNVKKSLQEWIYKNIGTIHTFQGKEACEVILILGCDGSRSAKGAINWVNENIINVAATRAKYRFYVIGDSKAWQDSNCVATAKKIIDTFAIREIQSILKGKLPEDEKKMALKAASASLPSVTAFPMDEVDSDEGDKDFTVDTTNLITALDTDFMKTELSNEQLSRFGFKSMDELNRHDVKVRKNLLLGMKLYYILKPVYEVNDKLDASCCAILFCKAMELHMQKCFADSIKSIFPEFKIKGFGPGRNEVNLKDANDTELTLGAFSYILQSKSSELGRIMEMMGKQIYDEKWWNSFVKKLRDFTKRRNKCCHSGLFTWEEQAYLLFNMFSNDSMLKEIKRTPKIGGIIFEGEIGKILNMS